MTTLGTIRSRPSSLRGRPGSTRAPPPFKAVSRHVKIVLIGDGAVGKTSLLARYASNEFNPEHEPTIFENCSLDRVIDGRKVELALWDNAGQEEFDQIRLLSYSNIDVFIIVFSVNNQQALEHVKTIWIPEILEYSQGVPLLLVGSKCDLRRVPGIQTATPEAGAKLARDVNAVAYMECSAKTSEGCSSVFEQAVREALASQAQRRDKNTKHRQSPLTRKLPKDCCLVS